MSPQLRQGEPVGYGRAWSRIPSAFRTSISCQAVFRSGTVALSMSIAAYCLSTLSSSSLDTACGLYREGSRVSICWILVTNLPLQFLYQHYSTAQASITFKDSQYWRSHHRFHIVGRRSWYMRLGRTNYCSTETRIHLHILQQAR